MYKTIFIISGLILSLLFLEEVYDFGLQHNQNLKAGYVASADVNARLLIHGPCEPLWMISPALLDTITGVPSYNLALSHSDFADNYLHLYLYLKNNKPPEFMLLYVTPESLDIRFNTFNAYRFAPYLSDTLVAATVKENDPDYFMWARLPFMKYAYYSSRVTFDVIQGYKHFFTHRTSAFYKDGFEPPATRAWGNHQGVFATLYHENTVFKVEGVREKYLLKTIRLAHDRGIKVYLYESPVLKESLKFQPNRNEMLAVIEKIAESEKVPYIRFEDLKMAQDRKYFISTLNFNLEGIALFNDTLGKYIKCNIIENR